MDNMQIAFQKSLNRGFIHLMQVELPSRSQLLNLAIAYICIGTDEGKKPSCSILFR